MYNGIIKHEKGDFFMNNRLKQKLNNAEQPIGIFFDTASEYLMECTGRSGIDFVIIDNEHSPIEAETSARLIRAAETPALLPYAACVR